MMRAAVCRWRPIVLLTVLIGAASRASAQPTAVPPVPTGPPPFPQPVTPPSQTGNCTQKGQVLSGRDFGLATGMLIADVTAMVLADGRVRLYAFAQGEGIVSAISLSADGLTFRPEPGRRMPDGSGMPRIVAMPGGGVRLFFTSGNGIKSATSPDGLTFTEEPGMRITAQALGFTDTTVAAASGAGVIQLADGRYRMYASDLPRPGDPPGGHRVKSAISTDMLTWTVEDGVRLGAEAPILTDSAEHPFPLANPDGSMTLFWGKFGASPSRQAEGVYMSTSRDGLIFERETLNVYMGNDPDLARLADGTLALDYGNVDATLGGGKGPSIFYDDANPFQGKQLFSFFGLSFQPNQHLSQGVEGNIVRFDRLTGDRVYAVDVINSRTTYQFDKHFLVRLLAQYDSSEHRVLTDVLASYEFVPGTVVHAGYGSLFERRDVRSPAGENSPVRLAEGYRATNRGLFFKASYLRRF